MRSMDLSMNLQTDVKRPPIITVGFQRPIQSLDMSRNSMQEQLQEHETLEQI